MILWLTSALELSAKGHASSPGYECITNVYVCFLHAYRLNSLESRSYRSESSHYSGQEYWLVLDRDL